MVCCVVQTCTRRSETSNRKKDGVSFHAFPKHPILRKEWTTFCRRAPSWQPKRTSVICSDHFDPSSFQTLANQRRLVENAIPTILPCDPENSQIIKLESQTQQDHQPCATHPIYSSASDKLQMNSQIVCFESQAQQDQQSRISNPIESSASESTASESSASDQLQNIQMIAANWKKKLQLKNKQIKKLQDNNRYLKIRLNNLQAVCIRLKKLLTKKMVQL